MNLGGRRIKNEELRAEFEELGFADVACFRASGNVVFSAKGSEAKLTGEIEAGLGEALGYEVPVFLRGAKELSALAAHEPFDAEEVKASKGKLQVALLPKKPAAKARKQALARPATRTGSRSKAASSTGCRAVASPNRTLT